MTAKLTVQPISTVSSDQQVRDYDQLDPEAKQFLADLADEGTETAVSSGVASSFARCEIVKYTNYVSVEVRDNSTQFSQ